MPAIAAEEIVITPHDSACTMVGDSWTESTSEKVQGPTVKTSYYKGKEVRYTLNVPPKIKDSRTFIPVRFISEQLGYNVEWNGETQEITITK